jgi:hypothetical protein
VGLLARSELGEVVPANVGVADGRLFIRGERHLYCISKKPLKSWLTGWRSTRRQSNAPSELT